MKSLSVAIDDETYIQFQHTLLRIAAEMGVERVSASVVLRDMILKLVRDPRVPFDQGWREGYMAAFSHVQRIVQEALHTLASDPRNVAEIGIGGSKSGGV